MAKGGKQSFSNSVFELHLYTVICFVIRPVLMITDSYNITNARGKVAKCIMFKQAYKLGEDIIGIMDFADGTVPCVQVMYGVKKMI